MTTPVVSVDANVRQVVKMLLAMRDETQADLAEAIGMQAHTLQRRLAGKGSGSTWAASEVAEIAKHFEVPVGLFYEGPRRLLLPGFRGDTAGLPGYRGDDQGGSGSMTTRGNRADIPARRRLA